MKKEAEIKETYEYPVTSSQEYGWREPIDTFATGFGMKHTFDEKLSTTLQSLNKGKKAPPQWFFNFICLIPFQNLFHYPNPSLN